MEAGPYCNAKNAPFSKVQVFISSSLKKGLQLGPTVVGHHPAGHFQLVIEPPILHYIV